MSAKQNTTQSTRLYNPMIEELQTSVGEYKIKRRSERSSLASLLNTNKSKKNTNGAVPYDPENINLNCDRTRGGNSAIDIEVEDKDFLGKRPLPYDIEGIS